MRIELKCYATLARFAPLSEGVDVPESATVADVITSLGMPQDEIKLIFINGVHVSADTILKQGDRLGLFPPVGGG